ncbi:Ig-like domain-containing protein [Bradyrhizobium sp. NAS80.1]|uniref:Ig-like domain-containing protein n=1 Tax=Bradyrhizobium sp. NAS80.1 TaxID=1680159 RepID=UPI00143D0300|nr:Ig-like domain-containing protein [Bradyrhizobium sp. NAS80.1]
MSDITLYGHRGGGDPYPDSTLESYTWGMNWGADFVEPDLYLTKDGVLVVSHDNIAGGFANVTYAEALAMNPALLTFGQVIDLVKQYSLETGRDIGIVPETKSTDYATSEAVVKTFIEHGFTDPSLIVIQSFSATNLQQLHDTIMVQYGVDFQLLQLTGSATSAQLANYATYADFWAPSIGSFTAADVAQAHADGLKVVAWTLNGSSQADIQNLIDMGVDAVFVDNMQGARPNEEAINGIKVIYGTPEWNVVNDTAGDDMIYAMRGDDIVRSTTGNDTLYGDGGNDLLFGGAGNDHLVGGSGTDYLSGGAGANVLDGSAGNDVIVATGNGDQVLFNSGDGIDLVSLNDTTTITFGDIKSTDVTVTVTEDNAYLIIRANANDAVVIRGTDLPAFITFADGVTWTGSELSLHATIGTDAAVAAALPDLEYVANKAPALATASTIAVGTDLVANDGIGNGHLIEQVENAENGAIYRLSFTLADLAGGEDTGVKVLWNNQVIYEGTPEGATKMHFIVTGGSGDGSNQLVFEGAGADSSVFDASLTDVHLVKLADPSMPSPNNAAPDAVDASVLVSQDIAISGKVTATDADSDALSFILGDTTQHGTLTFKADGSYVYTPNVGYLGADSFTYVVNDGHGGVDEATVNFNVMPGIVIGTDLIVNGSFEDISISTGNNGPNSGDWGYRNANGIIAGWTDVNGHRVEQHWDSPNGVVAKDGSIFIDMDGYNTNTHLVQTIGHVEKGATYQLSFSLADADTAVSDDGIQVYFAGQLVYEGVATNPWQTFTFTVIGGSGDGSNKLEFIATGTSLNTYGAALDDVHFIKIAEADAPLENHAPDAVDGTVDGRADTVITGKLTATDPDADILTFALKDAAAHGTVVVKADGTFEYTANDGFTGTDTFTYLVSDGHGGTDVATQHVTVDAPLPPPPVNLIVNGGFEDLTGANDVASWGYRNTSPAGVIAGWVNVADTRAEVHKDTVGGISAKEGTYWFDMEGANKNAKLVQTVAGIEEGATYQLKFSIADTDTAQTNDTIQVWWGGVIIYTGTPQAAWQEITIDVVGGAGDGSNKLAFESITASSNGAGVALDNVSMIKIDENPNLIINGSFEDLTGVNDSATWGYRNDKPAVIAGWTDLNITQKIELHASHAQDTTNNPIDAEDGKYYVDTVGSSAGTNIKLAQTVQGVDAGKTYKLTFWLADGDASHSDQGMNVFWGGKLVYSTSPGWDSATGTIAAGAAAGQPTAPNGQTWQEITVYVTGGDIVNGGVANQLIFQGTGNASGNNGAELDNVSLRLVNTAPVAVADTLPDVVQNSPSFLIKTADLLANDTDVDQDLLTITGVGSAAGGTVTLDQDGIHFTPTSGFTGEASFQYTISDGQGGAAVAHASFDVIPVDHAPMVTPVAPVTTDEDKPVTGQVVATDVDGDRLSYVIKGDGAANGNVTIDANGNWIYTPTANYHGADSFIVTVSDGHTSIDTVVAVTVNSVNDLPVTVADTGEVQLRDTATFDLVHNDTDVEDGQPHLTGFTVTGVDGVNVSTDAATSAFHIVDGQLVYDGGDIFSSLGDGQQATVTISYTAADNDGGHSAGQFVLTLDGLHAVSGTNGSDVLSDTTAADHITAGDGNDIIVASSGNDVIDAGTGNDMVTLESGDKIVNGGDGNDTINGGSGNSVLNGDAGNDNLFGGAGNSVLNGGVGNDKINGGDGNETIIGGAGNDQLSGGLGSDTFVFKIGDGHDKVSDFQAQGTDHDVIELDHNVFADFEALMASGAVHDSGNGVDISYADGSKLTLTGVSKASLTVDDFHFA